jgi:hypothetical protein
MFPLRFLSAAHIHLMSHLFRWVEVIQKGGSTVDGVNIVLAREFRKIIACRVSWTPEQFWRSSIIRSG